MIRKLYEAGANFTGGFVRDYLVRGECFNDVDFYFDEEPDWIQEWEQNGKRFFIYQDCIEYHCQRIIPGSSTQDLSCNLFSFNKERGLFARPTPYVFDYELGFKMLLNKQFAVLDLKDANIRFKMVERGWTEIWVSKRTSIVTAPEHGIWDEHTQTARERLEAVLT